MPASPRFETMPPPGEDPPERPARPLYAAQQRHERYIAAIAMTACFLGFAVLTWRRACA